MNTSLCTVEIVRESPPHLSIASWQVAIAYAGLEVWVLSTSCDIWVGSDKVGAWRELIPRWRRISLIKTGTLVFASDVLSYITYGDGRVFVPPPFGDQGGVTPPPFVPEPGSPAGYLSGGYIKVNRYRQGGIEMPIPNIYSRTGSIFQNNLTTGYTDQSANWLNNGGSIDVSGLITRGPTACAWPMCAINNAPDATLNMLSSDTLTMVPFIRKGNGQVGDDMSLPFYLSYYFMSPQDVPTTNYLMIFELVAANPWTAATMRAGFSGTQANFVRGVIIPMQPHPGIALGVPSGREQAIELECYFPNWAVTAGNWFGASAYNITQGTVITGSTGQSWILGYAKTPRMIDISPSRTYGAVKLTY